MLPTDRSRRTRRRAMPTYDLTPLLDRVRLTPAELADAVGRSRAHVYRRLKEGVLWSEADDWAVHFGHLPYDIWPEWAGANPADWTDLPDETQEDNPHAA